MALTKQQLVDLYRKRSGWYDLTANLYYLAGFREWAYRKKAVASLGLEPGDTVVEIGCGTGLNFPLLERAVGSDGRIIGVDLTDAMLREARQRTEHHGWTNVELLHEDAAAFEYPRQLNGVVSTFALTLSPAYDEIIRRGFESLEPGGRFVVADLKVPTGWSRKLLPLFLPTFRPFGVTLDLAVRHPWESIAKYFNETEIQEFYFGYTYIATGTKLSA